MNESKKIFLCAICNIESGTCNEDCKFCTQSVKYKANINRYKRKDIEQIIKEAKKHNRSYTPEQLYRYSFYLVDEEMHPMLFPVPLENPEDMPDDSDYICEEDFMG